MRNRIKEIIKKRKGFTLIEMVITISIVTILTGIISVGVYGYMLNAYMNRVNETAKTVFGATQNYLMEQKQLGKLSSFNELAENYGAQVDEDLLENIFLANDPDFDFDAYKEKYGTDGIRYILLEEGDGTTESDNPIYQIVKEYINDEDLLAHTFLIEYDTKSGVVRSVFYTEKTDSFSYELDADCRGDKENVILRDSDSLREKRQGYYGVDTTSLVKNNKDVDLIAPANVKLVNGERLYVEWEENNYLSPADILEGKNTSITEIFDEQPELKSELSYNVDIFRKTSGGDELLCSIENITARMSNGTTLKEADENAGANELVLSYDANTNTYQLLLDCIDRSILENFGMTTSINEVTVQKQVKAEDMLYCRISVKLEEQPDINEVESDTAVTNLQSANFAGGAKTYSATGFEKDEVEVYGNGNLSEDGSDKEYGSAFSIANARHFNNMRNVKNSSCFIQIADIDWTKPESDSERRSDFYFEPIVFAAGEGGIISGSADTNIFTGVFTNGIEDESYSISNLTINELTGSPKKNVGIFCQNKGTIDGLCLKNASIKGAYYVGAVAGSNAGTIKNVKIEDSAIEGAYYVGGLTGKNYEKGSLNNCTVEAEVAGNISQKVQNKVALETTEPAEGEEVPDYGMYIGGVAGVNFGTVTNVETGKENVSGTSYVGGLFGLNKNKSSLFTNVKVENNTNSNCLKTLNNTEITKNFHFGGIAGKNSKDGKILNCTNQSVVFLEKNKSNPKRIENIGGIAGTNDGLIETCHSVLESEQEINAVLNDCITNAKKGSLPVYSGVNVGGIAGVNSEDADIIACDTNNAVTGYKVVGGLVGDNQGEVYQSRSAYNAPYTEIAADLKMDGVVVATENFAGGVMGVNTSGEDIKLFTNSAHVFSSSLAGGIIGSNGGTGSYSFNTSEVDSAYYDALLQPKFDNVDKSALILKCQNNGFVYTLERYCGGITGVNFGKILSSNSSVDVSKDSQLKSLLKEEEYKSLAKADCVGGIAGYNATDAVITGDAASSTTAKAQVYGDDFVGGIVGLNYGEVGKYTTVEGNVYASGNCIGGFIGMNHSANSISSLTLCNGMHVYGDKFVGGIIGVNVSGGSQQVKIDRAVTRADGAESITRGTVYVGGILGYNTTNTDSLSALFAGELKDLMEHAYDEYRANAASESTNAATIFTNCRNYSDVYGERYVGGITGYNSDDTKLYISDTINYGKVAIENPEKVTDGYYFIGGITGRNSANGIIHNSANDGVVESPSIYLGGICEVNEGWIQFCSIGKSEDYSQGGITGENSVGGLVGLNSKYVIQCGTSPHATIQGGNNTGGLVGTNDENGVITGDASLAKTEAGIISLPAQSGNGQCVSSASVIGKENTGGVVGLNKGSVEDVSVKDANISGTVYVGGFIGSNEGYLKSDENQELNVIQGLENDANKVIGEHQVGGIVGKHKANVIKDCINSGIVEATGTGANGYAGGITGSVGQNIKIENCTNYGTVTSKYSQAGGITGNNNGILKECKNYGSVTGSWVRNAYSAIGGITGINESYGEVIDCISDNNQNDPQIAQNPNSDTTNEIRGIYLMGGMVGQNKGSISNENAGKEVSINITAEDRKISDICFIGGIVGVSNANAGTSVYKDYIYSGTITVGKNASDYQRIGGITSKLENGMTLDNCTFAGQIVGYGNKYGYSNSGVGGLVGEFVGGSIIVSQNVDGIYTSNTSNSLVEGGWSVGGTAGCFTGGDILIREPGKEPVKLEELSCNTDDNADNDIYYTNLATVSGSKRVGGFYGRMESVNANEELSISHYQNGLAGYTEIANIRVNTKFSGLAEAFGGIVGTNHGGRAKVCLYNMINYGTIGDRENYYLEAQYIGGIIGNVNASYGTELDSLVNKGIISSGKLYIGGIFGSSNIELRKYIDFSVNNCQNYAYIRGKSGYIGGIGGFAYHTTVSNCQNTGNVVNSSSNVAVGGIMGEIRNNSNVVNCQNSGTVKLNSSNATGVYAGIGGIVGRAQNDFTITECTNNGVVEVVRSKAAAGIVGVTNGYGNQIVANCENNGEVRGSCQDVGGIIGWAYAGSPNTKIYENVNRGTIYAKSRSGGIVGALTPYNEWEIRDCTNYGDIYIYNTKDADCFGVQAIGGTVGYYESMATVQNFVNEGNIIVLNEADEFLEKDADAKAATSISKVGGIVGEAKYRTTQTDQNFLECVNRGQIIMQDGHKVTSMQSIGGIAGNLYYMTGLKSCVNEATLDFSNYEGTMDCLGGILGKGENPAWYSVHDNKLSYCVNYGSVLGNTEKARYVGGIAGYTRGLVYSCKTENKDGTVGEVTGYKCVGGLVGKAYKAECKITSIVNEENKGYDITQNNFNVKGVMNVGGLVGLQEAATLHTAVNMPGVTVTLLDSQDKEDDYNKKAAGGIVGLSILEDGKIPGVVANCYNFGEVRFEKDDMTKYLGGIIGYRSNHQFNGPSVAIKDSFYLYDDVNYDYVDESQPDSKKPLQVLAIGNEPAGSYKHNEEDQQYGDKDAPVLSTEERFCWSEDAYENMYRAIHDLPETVSVDTSNWADVQQVINNILDYYNLYKLPVPDTDAVVPLEGYTYNLPIKKMPGFCEKIEVIVYDGSAITENVGDVILEENRDNGKLWSTTIDIDKDDQIDDVELDLTGLEEYIGQEIKVAVKVYGVEEAVQPPVGNLTYTTDSNLEVVESFIMMPPLVAPEVELVSQSGTEATFVVTNWEEYKKSAAELYEAIANNAEIKDYPIYEQILNGLENFTITDYYQKTEADTSKNVLYQWNVLRSDIDETTGQFVLDYSKDPQFDSRKSDYPWHSWEIKAVSTNANDSIEAAWVKADSQARYRYVNSDFGNCEKYKIEAVKQLIMPTELEVNYVGGTDWLSDAATPSYEITFQKSDSPEEAIAYYLITVTNPANGKTHTYQYVAEPDPVVDDDSQVERPICNYALDKDTLLGDGDNQLALDLTAGSEPTQLEVTVSAIPTTEEAGRLYLPSDNAVINPKVIKQAEKVDEPMWITTEDPNNTNKLTFHWNDSNATGSDTYLVYYTMTDENGGVSTSDITKTQEREYTLTVPANAGECTIEVNVIRQGSISNKQVVSLNSDPVTCQKVIGEKIASVTNVTATLSRTEGEMLYYKTEFTVPTELTAQNCKGFIIQAVNTASSGETISEVLEIPYDYDFTMPIEIGISSEHQGKNFVVHVISEAMLDASENSEPGVSGIVTIPNQKLEKPESITATVISKDADGNEKYNYDLTSTTNPDTGVENSFLYSEFADMTYSFGWTLGADAANVNNQCLELYDGDELIETMVTDGTLSKVATDWQIDLTEYAGKELTLKVYSQPILGNVHLPSEPETVTIHVPKIRLDGPTFSEDAEVENTDLTYTINWLEKVLAEDLPEAMKTARTGTKISITYVDGQDADRNDIIKPVEYQVLDASTYESAVDGVYVLPYTQPEEESGENQEEIIGMAIFKFLDADTYAGKTIKISISYTTDITTVEQDGTETVTPNETYAESYAAELEITLPN